jgi:hypothetical protein
MNDPARPEVSDIDAAAFLEAEVDEAIALCAGDLPGSTARGVGGQRVSLRRASSRGPRPDQYSRPPQRPVSAGFCAGPDSPPAQTRQKPEQARLREDHEMP